MEMPQKKPATSENELNKVDKIRKAFWLMIQSEFINVEVLDEMLAQLSADFDEIKRGLQLAEQRERSPSYVMELRAILQLLE